jgi:hypothetical protein
MKQQYDEGKVMPEICHLLVLVLFISINGCRHGKAIYGEIGKIGL